MQVLGEQLNGRDEGLPKAVGAAEGVDGAREFAHQAERSGGMVARMEITQLRATVGLEVDEADEMVGRHRVRRGAYLHV